MKKKLLSIFALILVLMLTFSALASCNIIGGNNDDPDTDDEEEEEDNGGGSNTNVDGPATVEPEKDANGVIYVKHGDYYMVNGYMPPVGASEINLVIPSVFNNLPVKSIGNRAFIADATAVNSSIKTITVSEGIITVCSNAFANCESLETVNLPASLTAIELDAFIRCPELKAINVHESNQNYKTVDGNLFSKDGKVLVRYAVGQTASNLSYTVAEGVTTIAQGAFTGAALKTVTLPSTITRIEPQAFIGANSLTAVNVNADARSGWKYTEDEYDTGGTSINASVMSNAATLAGNLTNYASYGRKYLNRTV